MQFEIAAEDEKIVRDVAKRQHENGLKLKTPFDAYDGNEARRHSSRLNSTAAECALSRWVGVEWPKSDFVFDGPDVGHWIQVKWTDVVGGGIIVQPKSKEKRPIHNYAYALLQGEMPFLKLIGWVGGALIEDRGLRKMRTGANQVYYFPQNELRRNFDLLKLIGQSGVL